MILSDEPLSVDNDRRISLGDVRLAHGSLRRNAAKSSPRTEPMQASVPAKRINESMPPHLGFSLLRRTLRDRGVHVSWCTLTAFSPLVAPTSRRLPLSTELLRTWPGSPRCGSPSATCWAGSTPTACTGSRWPPIPTRSTPSRSTAPFCGESGSLASAPVYGLQEPLFPENRQGANTIR